MTQTQVKLIRVECSPRGTAGVLLANDKFICMTLERPWLNNEVNKSCIPTGTYQASLYSSSKFGETYVVEDVPGRTGILFHKGNEITDSTGCILLGQEIKPMQDRLSLVSSTTGFMRFKTVLVGVKKFVLRVC